MAKLWIPCWNRIFKLSSKSKLTWTLITMTTWQLCPYRIRWVERGMVSICLVLGRRLPSFLMSPSLWRSRRCDNAVAGDIIRVYDTGTYQVGDTLTVGKNKFEFWEPLSVTFTWIFMKVSAKNVVTKITPQGYRTIGAKRPFSFTRVIQTGDMLGAVGQLSLGLLSTAWKANTVRVVMKRWVKRPFVGSSYRDLDRTDVLNHNILAKDRFDQPVFLFENDFALRWFADKCPDVKLEEKNVAQHQRGGQGF